MKIDFHCPNPDCGGTILEEVLTNVTQRTNIDFAEKLDDGTVALDYGPTVAEEGEVNCYCCATCGNILKDGISKISTPEELLEFLQKQGMVH